MFAVGVADYEGSRVPYLTAHHPVIDQVSWRLYFLRARRLTHVSMNLHRLRKLFVPIVEPTVSGIQ